MTYKRINRDTLYLQIAELFAKRGTCERLRVGAIVVRDKRICCSGYNGTPPGEGHCSEECNIKKSCKVSIHAEANLIASAAKHGVSLEHTTLYITHSPCKTCSELIIQAGIKRVVFMDFYGKDGLLLLEDQGIIVDQYAVN